MGLETGVTYIEDLDETWPLGSDDPDTLDDHDRNIKTAVKGSLPNLGAAAVTATAAELNIMDGITAFLDEDDMASDSATAIASQQSIKAFVNTKLGSLNQKIVNIGDWDMDTTTNVSVAHGLTFSKIRSISAMIVADSSNALTDFSSHDLTTGTSTHYMQAQSTNIVLRRATSGFFDTSSYSTTPFNRGYIVIQYID